MYIEIYHPVGSIKNKVHALMQRRQTNKFNFNYFSIASCCWYAVTKGSRM